MPVQYVLTKSGSKQHILKREGELYCTTGPNHRRVTTNIAWSKVKIREERLPDVPLCNVCEALGPLTDEDTRRFWTFTAEDLK